MLTAIKLLHTVIWAGMAACIFALPVFAVRGRFRASALLSAIVWIECGVLALNRGRCPLTDWASRFTSERGYNFDIYLPVWLAQYNKVIFGTLFLVGQLVLLACWAQRIRSNAPTH